MGEGSTQRSWRRRARRERKPWELRAKSREGRSTGWYGGVPWPSYRLRQPNPGNFKRHSPQVLPAEQYPGVGFYPLIRGRRDRRGGHAAVHHIVAPILHGANSAAPKSCMPRSWCARPTPRATSPSSKICWPDSCTDKSPSRMAPQFTSMSSSIRWNIGVLVASLIDGAGLQPNTLPRPVVKAHHARASGHLPGYRHRVVARRVHEHEATLRDRLGIVHHVHQIAAAGLGHRAERFFQDRCRPPSLLPGEGLRPSRPPRAPYSLPTSASGRRVSRPPRGLTARRGQQVLRPP